ncbi:hypothetical protein KEM48_004766 [Puccinia striiformis f. sp. tritici PST-130]|nr:hypothetical protein KEM48_004766 [Puccinia striiformis f. sp. tritici PST-130]
MHHDLNQILPIEAEHQSAQTAQEHQPSHPTLCTNRARTTSSSTLSTSSPLITIPLFNYSTRSSSQAISSSKPWKMHTDIEYRDLKPITEMPSDVNLFFY